MTDDPTIPCPNCGPLNVECMAVVTTTTDPSAELPCGCLDCEYSLPRSEWIEAVAAKKSHWEHTPRPS